MAEMDTYHQQKVQDFSTITKDHLDGEIEFYEQVRDLLQPSQVCRLIMLRSSDDYGMRDKHSTSPSTRNWALLHDNPQYTSASWSIQD